MQHTSLVAWMAGGAWLSGELDVVPGGGRRRLLLCAARGSLLWHVYKARNCICSPPGRGALLSSSDCSQSFFSTLLFKLSQKQLCTCAGVQLGSGLFDSLPAVIWECAATQPFLCWRLVPQLHFWSKAGGWQRWCLEDSAERAGRQDWASRWGRLGKSQLSAQLQQINPRRKCVCFALSLPAHRLF